ncbi:MAG: dihydrofolate reductase [Acidobacteria bacterium]|nr:MAG: dihydrofolate reductase [Acidobacteriota bacterium]
MRLSIIVAVAESGVIGRGNDLPWYLPADLKRFKQLTMGHHLLMGRKTFEAIGRALPGRTTVVISRGQPTLPDGVELAGSLDEAVKLAAQADDDEAFVAGGAQIYHLTLPRADRLYLTRIHAAIEGDTRFPDLPESDWTLVSQEDHTPDEKNEYRYSFLVYDRTAAASGD